MLEETISRIEKEIRENESLSEERRDELLGLVQKLRGEIATLDESHREDVQSIAKYTETTIGEAVRKSRNVELLRHSLEGMSLSVRRYEVSHPKLVGVINAIGRTLYNLGI